MLSKQTHGSDKQQLRMHPKEKARYKLYQETSRKLEDEGAVDSRNPSAVDIAGVRDTATVIEDFDDLREDCLSDDDDSDYDPDEEVQPRKRTVKRLETLSAILDGRKLKV